MKQKLTQKKESGEVAAKRFAGEASFAKTDFSTDLQAKLNRTHIPETEESLGQLSSATGGYSMSVLKRLKQIIPSSVLTSIGCALILAACLTGVNSAKLVPHQTQEPSTQSSTSGAAASGRMFLWVKEVLSLPENGWMQGGGRIRTDHAVYPKPPLPALPRAGGKYIDPVFGTEIMRVTDETDGPAPGLGTYYSHWPTFNCNNTKLLIRKGETGEAILKDFDAANFRLGAGYVTLPSSFPGADGGPNWESSIWSSNDPNLIYTFPNYYDGGMKLYTYNIATKTFRLIKDFKALSGGKDYLKQMYMSVDEDVFCWLQHRYGANDGEPIAYIVYKRSTDKVLFHNSALDYVGGINEVHVDKSGKWLHVVVPTNQPDGTGTRFLNLETGEYQALRKEVDHPPGHGDLGYETMVGFDNYEGGISKRRLENAHKHTILLLFQNLQKKTDWTFDHHGTMLADDESWETIGTYHDPSVNLPNYHLFEDEILQVATDGSQRIRRLCHTRSFYDNKTNTTGYWATPKPTISKDGRYIAFTSNWENSGRYDLFIVKIEPGESLLPKTTPAMPLPTQRPRRVRPV